MLEKKGKVGDAELAERIRGLVKAAKDTEAESDAREEAAEELWYYAFDLKRVGVGRGEDASKTFAGSINTDGVSASVTVSRQRAQHEIDEINAKKRAPAEHKIACDKAKAQGRPPPAPPEALRKADAAGESKLVREAQLKRAKEAWTASRLPGAPSLRIVGLDPGRKSPFTRLRCTLRRRATP